MKESPRFQNPITRRRLLIGTAATAALAIAEGPKIVEKAIDIPLAIWDQMQTHNRAKEGNDKFLAENSHKLQKLEFGCSFAPEEFLTEEDYAAEDITQSLGYKNAFRSLAWITDLEGLNMKHVRLGTRWNMTVGANGNFNFGFYKPFFDLCLKNDVKVCLNIGPIKQFRWPETHIAENVLSSVDIPPEGSTITPEMDLVTQGLDYVEALFSYLKTEYAPWALANIEVIQPENEPYTDFGKRRWKMDQAYIWLLAQKINEHFPQASILLNSAGYSNLEEIRDTFKRITTNIPPLKGKLISGFDYYYKLPKNPELPIIREELDPVTKSRIFAGDICESNIRWARKYGYRIELTEGQTEPYGYRTSPGNSAEGFRFMLLRTIENILDIAGQEKSVFRIWGIEKLAPRFIFGTQTEEHERIIEIIKYVNRASAAREAYVRRH